MDYIVVNKDGKIVDFKEEKNKKIIFYGASTRNKLAIEELNIQSNILFFVDKNKEKIGKIINGYLIEPIEKISKYPEAIIISVLIKYTDEILNILKIYNNYKYFFIVKEFNLVSIKKSNIFIIKNNYKYKYIHFFPHSLFIKIFYIMLEKEFFINEHLFIINYSIRDDVLGILDFVYEKNIKNHNILIFDSAHCNSNFLEEKINCNTIFYSEEINIIFTNAYKIFFHSVLLENSILDLAHSLTKTYSNKMAWLSWGGDAYSENVSTSVMELIRKIKYAYVPQARYQDVIDNYKVIPRTKKNIYCYINETEIKDIKERTSINILLGHSGQKYVNHKYGFKLLEKYHDKNIKIYSPLIYGESLEYRKKIAKLGEQYFGEKFIPMFDYMEQNQYYKFLQKIDVAIFPMNRACAGTTLLYLSAIGKKIYMNTEIARHFYNSNLDIHSEDIEELEKISFEEFIGNINYSMNREEKIEHLNKETLEEVRRILEDD